MSDEELQMMKSHVDRLEVKVKALEASLKTAQDNLDSINSQRGDWATIAVARKMADGVENHVDALEKRIKTLEDKTKNLKK